LAWKAFELSSFWTLSCSGFFKGNFDVAICDNFAVAVVVISNSDSKIILATTQKLSITDALIGDASTALFTSRPANIYKSYEFSSGDSCCELASYFFSSWHFAPYISDIRLELSVFQSWNASKVSRCVNLRAHVLAKWVATHIVFGSIPSSLILSSIMIKNGKDPPM
jgi:hypothetical protein